jgi:hypothetical protein
MRIAAELRAVEMSSGHQFEEEIGASSSESVLFIAKMEFSVRTAVRMARSRPHPLPETGIHQKFILLALRCALTTQVRHDYVTPTPERGYRTCNPGCHTIVSQGGTYDF